jgi:tRNA(adenine34) deaminase
MNEVDTTLLRRAIALSVRARDLGDAPYGALLADDTGRVLLEACNTQVSGRDCTAHAELNLMRVASSRFAPDQLASCSVFASGEPCPMCAGAIYWAGIGRIVFGLSIERMTALGGPGADELSMHCAEVTARGTRRRVEVVGPALEDEAQRVVER